MEQAIAASRSSAAQSDAAHDIAAGKTGIAAAAGRVLQRIIRRPELERVTGLPRSTIYEKIAKGEFPKPIPISGRRVGWLESEILDWQRARIAEREASNG